MSFGSHGSSGTPGTRLSVLGGLDSLLRAGCAQQQLQAFEVLHDTSCQDSPNRLGGLLLWPHGCIGPSPHPHREPSPSPQNGGNVWPSEPSRARALRAPPDSRLGNISLIPLRGNENEMRNSVAAFATDPLTVSDGRLPGGGSPGAGYGIPSAAASHLLRHGGDALRAWCLAGALSGGQDQ